MGKMHDADPHVKSKVCVHICMPDKDVLLVLSVTRNFLV